MFLSKLWGLTHHKSAVSMPNLPSFCLMELWKWSFKMSMGRCPYYSLKCQWDDSVTLAYTPSPPTPTKAPLSSATNRNQVKTNLINWLG